MMRASVIALVAATAILAPLAFAQSNGDLPGASIAAIPALATAPLITHAVWLRSPSGGDFMRNWPRQAYHQHIGGIAILDCLIKDDGTLTCVTRTENPSDGGFGQAAVAISRSFRMAPQNADGQATSGGRIVVPITFRFAS